MIYAIVAVIILIVIGAWVVSTYNFFVSSKARIKAANLIPNLEASVKGYLKQEKTIFEQLTNARKAINAAVESGDLQKMSNAAQQLATVLPNINVVVEDNPELKSSEVVTKLMEELRDTADKVMYARRLVIDLTADYNVKRVSFPSNLVAGMFNFEELAGIATPTEGEHLQVDTEELDAPKVEL